MHILATAQRWFGYDRWQMISQLFMPTRAADLLKLEYFNILNCPKKAAYLAQVMINALNPAEAMLHYLQ